MNSSVEHAEAINTLLARIAQKDSVAFEQFYRLNVKTVYLDTLRILRDAGSAEEATQDVFTQVWLRADRYDASRGRPCGWLRSLARSRAIDLFRRRRSDSRMEPIEVHTLWTCDGTEQETIQRLGRRMLQELVDQLPPNQRLVILMAFYYGYTHQEIAGRTEIPLGTVKTWIRAALARLGVECRGDWRSGGAHSQAFN